MATAASIALYELRRQRVGSASADNSHAPGGPADVASAVMVEPVVRRCATTSSSTAARIVNRAMLGSVTDEVNEGWASLIDPERALGAFSADGRARRLRP